MQPKTPLFTSDSQHPPRFRHAVYLGVHIRSLKSFGNKHIVMDMNSVYVVRASVCGINKKIHVIMLYIFSYRLYDNKRPA